MAAIQGGASGLVMSGPMRSGPGGSATASPSGSGPSSLSGSEADIAIMLRRVGWAVELKTVMQEPLTSRMLIVTGQMMSILSPRIPAKMALVPSAVGNGHERTATVGVAFETWRRNAIWLTRVDSQSLARRVTSGSVLENVAAAMQLALSAS